MDRLRPLAASRAAPENGLRTATHYHEPTRPPVRAPVTRGVVVIVPCGSGRQPGSASRESHPVL